jgi:SAM-dependent methyltransferase
MSAEPSQQPIWSHFQNETQIGIFRAARPRHAAILRKLKRLADCEKPVVLNIGAGDGNFERLVRDLGWPSHSLDPDAATVERLRAQGIEAKRGSIEAIGFEDGRLDFVVASEVLEHLTPGERRAGLMEIRRTLKPGGYLVGTVPYGEDLGLNVTVCPKCGHVFHRWGHTTSFDLATIRAELAPYFGSVSCRRTAFVEFKGRSLGGKLKSLARLILGKCGAAIAVPSIFFVAQRS